MRLKSYSDKSQHFEGLMGQCFDGNNKNVSVKWIDAMKEMDGKMKCNKGLSSEGSFGMWMEDTEQEQICEKN